MSFLLWGGHGARSWVQFEGSQLSVSPVPQGTAPGRGTSTALGVAEQIHPHPVSGAKLKEVRLAQNPLSGLKTPLPTPGCSVQSCHPWRLHAREIPAPFPNIFHLQALISQPPSSSSQQFSGFSNHKG